MGVAVLGCDAHSAHEPLSAMSNVDCPDGFHEEQVTIRQTIRRTIQPTDLSSYGDAQKAVNAETSVLVGQTANPPIDRKTD